LVEKQLNLNKDRKINLRMNIEIPNNDNFPSATWIKNVAETIVFALVPENHQEIEKITENVTLKITDSEEFRCEALSFGGLLISRKAIEIIWAFCYGYFTIYIHKLSGTDSIGQYVDLASNPKLLKSRKLLTWALNNLQGNVSEIPKELPSIADNWEIDSKEHAISDLTQCVLAFFLFHELAHLKFQGTY